MPVGFQSITPGGVLQIDAERKCYVLKASGIAVTDSFKIAYFTHALSAYTAPLVFWQEDFAPFCSQTTGVGIPSGHIGHFAYGTASGQSARWYLYDVISGAPSSFGFQLFNSAGELTFDAAQRPLVPYGIVSGVKPSSGSTLSVNSGRTYAVHIPTAPIRYTYVDIDEFLGPYGTYEIVRPNKSGSTLSFSAFDYLGSTTPGDYTNWEREGATAFIVDVHDFIAT